MLLSSSSCHEFDETSSDDGETFHTPSSRDDEDVWTEEPSDLAHAFRCLGGEETTENKHLVQGLKLSCITDLKSTASPKILLTTPEFNPFSAAFSEELLRSGCHSPGDALSPSGSSTSTLFSPEQEIHKFSNSRTEEYSITSHINGDNHDAINRQPKLLRPSISDFLPATSARAYSPRFPLGHALCSTFVKNYSLDGELGSGGYGFVMAAKARQNGIEVAVKFITKDKIPAHCWAYDDAGNEVPLEAKILAMLDHNGIVKFIDLFDDELYFYLVQELHGAPWSNNSPPVKESLTLPSVPPHGPFSAQSTETVKDGQVESSNNDMNIKPAQLAPQRPATVRRPSHDLFECLEQSKNKRFSESDAKFIFAQVVDVVDYLDRHGITHCDIKDENVVVDSNLRIKLIDFGSAVVADPRQTRPLYTKFFGTTAYASPEVVLKRRYRACTAEIWSLGILLSYLLTGMSPFISESDKLVGRIILDSSVNVSQSCLHLMRRCLQADPEHRADIAEVKAHPWLTGALGGGL